MQATLKIEPDEIDDRLLNVIRELLSRNVEITIKRHHVELNNFDAAQPLDKVMEEFQKAGYSDDFISDLRAGFETSEIYAK